jgi:protein-S-isoprenylcysteine O-methyltransferase Ste14
MDAEVSNAGLLRPPLIYLTAIVTGIALEVVWPTSLLPGGLAPLGVVLVAVAVGLFVLSIRALRAAGTSVRGNVPTAALVRRGPYALSRNPIYVSFFLLQLGIALWLGSAWVLATLIPAALVIARVVVPREERYLERRLGGEYGDYRTAVRRWL